MRFAKVGMLNYQIIFILVVEGAIWTETAVYSDKRKKLPSSAKIFRNINLETGLCAHYKKRIHLFQCFNVTFVI